MLKQILQTNLRKFRLKAGMTQREVADGSGYTLSYISETERKNKQPTLDAIEGFAKALGLKDPLTLLRK